MARLLLLQVRCLQGAHFSMPMDACAQSTCAPVAEPQLIDQDLTLQLIEFAPIQTWAGLPMRDRMCSERHLVCSGAHVHICDMGCSAALLPGEAGPTPLTSTYGPDTHAMRVKKKSAQCVIDLQIAHWSQRLDVATTSVL